MLAPICHFTFLGIEFCNCCCYAIFRSSFELMAPKIDPAAHIHGPISRLSVFPGELFALARVTIITMTEMKKAMAEVTVAR
jgi:hypothetical protein